MAFLGHSKKASMSLVSFGSPPGGFVCGHSRCTRESQQAQLELEDALGVGPVGPGAPGQHVGATISGGGPAVKL